MVHRIGPRKNFLTENIPLEVVAFSSNQQSLPVVVQFEGEGEISSSYDFSSLVYVLIAIIGIVPLSIFLLLRFTNIQKFF